MRRLWTLKALIIPLVTTVFFMHRMVVGSRGDTTVTTTSQPLLEILTWAGLAFAVSKASLGTFPL
jgi:hypothetical protein